MVGEVEQIRAEGDIDLRRDHERLEAIRRGEWTEGRLRSWFAGRESHLGWSGSIALTVVLILAFRASTG